MKWRGLTRVRGLCQACLSTTDVVNPKHYSLQSTRFLDKEEINHKEIRQNALQLLRKGMITKEEYILVLDADLKYGAGLDITSIQLDTGTRLDSSPCPESDSAPSCPIPSSTLVDIAASMCPPIEGNVDPVTLEELGPNTFTFVTPQGNSIEYNIETLAHYIASSGDFRDPVTRFPLSPDDIVAIDERIAADDACRHLSTLKSVRENSQYYCIEKQKKEECQNLETCLGELIVDMLEIIETPTMGPKAAEQAEMRLIVLFSEFDSPFKLLKSLDIEQARHSLLTWQVFLRGPAKRPTRARGPRGVLSSAEAFLQGQWTEQDQQQLRAFQAKFEK